MSDLVLKSEEPMTHKEAVRFMVQWLKNAQSCSVVMAELATRNHETPDLIGWRQGHSSILLEIKVSRGDFRADRTKDFRVDPDSGMGDHRYFVAPKGMLRVDEIPENWGLLEIENKRRVLHTRRSEFHKANKSAEVTMLTSAIRRLELSTAVFVRQDTAPE